MTPEDIRTIYKVALNNEDGHKVLNDLAARFHIHGSTFTNDPCETAYREGQRTVVLFLLSMLREQKEKELIN